jgi:molecular chaperone GrpE
LKDLLPVLDSFELAVPSDTVAPDVDAGEKSFHSGVLMVKKQMLDTLKKHGLEQIDAKDKPFDPNFHQAIQRVESAEHKEETVAGEFQKGYVLNGRLIRPAMVSVFIPV